MAPRARRCAGCGGPLPDSPAGAATVTCPFCGIVNDLPSRAPAPQPIVVTLDVGKAAAQLGRGAKIAVGIGLGVAGLVIAFGVLRAVRPITGALEDVRRQADAMDERMRALAPAELATVGESGWRAVTAPAPPGGWTAFDPVRGLGWATTIARAWAGDATLTRIDVSRASAAGVVNLAGELEDSVGYRFVSPARIADWERRADREVNAQAAYELMMRIAREKVTANVVSGRPSTRERTVRDPDSLPLAEVLARARKNARFGDYPFYAGYLIHLDREGWVWYLSSLSGRESMPRVRARDGAVFPYREPR
jgi:hypothetical protein